MEVKNIHRTEVLQHKTVFNGELKLFSIENSRGTKLVISNCGAAVTSLLMKNKHGQMIDVVLGYEHPVDYLTDDYYIGTVVGRYANRIAGNTVLINGHSYKLSTKEGGYHQHGGTVGFNKKCFEATTFKKLSSTGIIFRYTSPHLEEGFPGELALEVVYTLDDDDTWNVEYKAVSSHDTLINLTQHTYFNLSGHPETPINMHELSINAKHYLPVNAMQVPTGVFEAVSEGPFDFTSFKCMGKDINHDDPQLMLSSGYDHSFILEDAPSTQLKQAAVVKDASSGIMMEIYTTEPAIHFYSGNFLKNIKGKNGIVYNQRAGFCLETQHFPDAPNHPHFPTTILKRGDTFYSKTVFKFSVEI